MIVYILTCAFTVSNNRQLSGLNCVHRSPYFTHRSPNASQDFEERFDWLMMLHVHALCVCIMHKISCQLQRVKLVELLFAFVEAVFVAPKSEELGIAT